MHLTNSAGGGYIKRKISKVYPLHLVTMLATMAFMLVSSSITVSQCAIRLIPQLLMVQAFIPVESFYFSFNKLSWYLSLFLLFSVVDQPLLKWMNQRDRRKLELIIGAVLFVQLAWYAVFGTSSNAHWLCYINPVFRLSDYILGISLGGIFKSRSSMKNGKRLTATFLEVAALILIIAVLPVKFVLQHEFYRLTYTVTAAFAIYIFALQNGTLSDFFGKPIFVRASNQTLNWYLMHQIVIHAVMIFVSNELICFVLTILVVSIGCFLWTMLLKNCRRLRV